MSLSNQTEPSRMLLGSDGPNTDLDNPLVDQVPNADGGRQAPGHGQRAIQDQQLKRSRAEPEGDVLDDYGGRLKKHKNRNVRVFFFLALHEADVCHRMSISPEQNQSRRRTSTQAQGRPTLCKCPQNTTFTIATSTTTTHH
jgi:hypothetical protein